MEICLMKYFEGGDTSFDFEPKQILKMFIFYSKTGIWNLKLPEIVCKNNGKWKLQTCFSRNYDFAFANLLKKCGRHAARGSRVWDPCNRWWISFCLPCGTVATSGASFGCALAAGEARTVTCRTVEKITLIICNRNSWYICRRHVRKSVISGNALCFRNCLGISRKRTS